MYETRKTPTGRDMLEHAALIWSEETVKLQDNPPCEHEIELSKAISLKRIADVLESVVDYHREEVFGPAVRTQPSGTRG